MKVFIVYASAGAGHRKAAEAVFNSFRSKSPSCDIRLIDILEKSNHWYAAIYAHGYRFLINYAAWLWAVLFYITTARILRLLTSAAVKALDMMNTRRFSDLIVREQPDIVISTHFMPPEILGHLKQRGKIKSRLITVITDFGIHPLWISRETDNYVAASSLSGKNLIRQGVPAENIWEFGIPVDERFSKEYDKAGIRKGLGLSPDEFTLLVTTGSFGRGPVEKIVAALHEKMQIIVVCAKNQKLYAGLNKAAPSNTKIFGFVDNIHELMAASDIVIAKPGGLTTSEILSMELVPVFISPIPGQETHNLKVMREFGVGKYGRSLKDIERIVLDYRDNPMKLANEKKIIKKIKKPHSAEDLYNALC